VRSILRSSHAQTFRKEPRRARVRSTRASSDASARAIDFPEKRPRAAPETNVTIVMLARSVPPDRDASLP